MSFCLLFCSQLAATETTVFDPSRDRHIPIKIYKPSLTDNCSRTPCPVTFLNAGYRMQHTDYSFIANALNKKDYLVIAVAHELPEDPPLSRTGNLLDTRMENWQRGAQTLIFLRNYFAKQMPNYDFNDVTLVGHSNGGDISALLADTEYSWIKHLITLDHRRYPLPRSHNLKSLSLRATDYPADPGVLLTRSERKSLGSCSITIEDAKHNDMSDYGEDWLKKRIVKELLGFLQNERFCESLH
ncbi:MAG: alpha/beta hydrolase [Alteromonadaceae bacterium]|nr:alpha/beta hydrolase [Alteromonadaceae bacterium]